MTQVRAGLIHFFRSICICGLIAACVVSFLVSYAYMSGDHIDRADMKKTADHYASYIRVIPQAQAESTVDLPRELASEY